MSDHIALAPLIGGIGLLERAIGFTLGSLQLVTPEAMSRPTPCREWNLRALLAHMNDSLAALHEAVRSGRISTDPVSDSTADTVRSLRDRACRTLGDWSNVDTHQLVAIGGQRLPAGLVTAAGAMDVAVHGWDVAAACGDHRPIPDALAEELIELAPLLVTAADRPGRFAPPATVSPHAGASDRLVAFLGRPPG